MFNLFKKRLAQPKNDKLYGCLVELADICLDISKLSSSFSNIGEIEDFSYSKYSYSPTTQISVITKSEDGIYQLKLDKDTANNKFDVKIKSMPIIHTINDYVKKPSTIYINYDNNYELNVSPFLGEVIKAEDIMKVIGYIRSSLFKSYANMTESKLKHTSELVKLVKGE